MALAMRADTVGLGLLNVTRTRREPRSGEMPMLREIRPMILPRRRAACWVAVSPSRASNSSPICSMKSLELARPSLSMTRSIRARLRIRPYWVWKNSSPTGSSRGMPSSVFRTRAASRSIWMVVAAV